MKMSAYMLPVVLMIFSAAPAYASVSVSSDAKGSDVHVTVNSTVNSSSTTNTTSTSNCNTNIHMETNGQVQDFNSSNCDSVHLQSDDGHSTVSINNNGNSTSVSPFPHISITPRVSIDEQRLKNDIQKKVDKEKAAIEAKKKQIQQQQNTLFEKIKTFLQKLFFLHF